MGSVRFSRISGIVFLIGVLHNSVVCAQDDSEAPERTSWTTSTIQGSPEPALPWTTTRLFPDLKFDRCLEVVPEPNSERLWVVEQSGKIFSFTPDPKVKSADLVGDLADISPGTKQAYALAFHPEFAGNHHVYVCMIREPNDPEGSRISRFTVRSTDPPTLDPDSELVILTWLSGGHNGCCLKFGPDGYLYVSTGDGGPANPPDPHRSGQDLGNLLSAILRIDVDGKTGDRNYRIPDDNPFASTEGARGEIWAYGLRNPWRMSFDRKTGDLWVGDVGWELWEMLHRVEPGANFGWSVMEGRQPTNPEWSRGPTPVVPPLIEHPHSESSSITDGLTYHGSGLPGLRGHHVYGDYDTGKIWAFEYRNGRVVEHREIADSSLRIVSFGEDHDGELIIVDHTSGTLHGLVPNPRTDEASDFPVLLSQSGIFTDTENRTPAAGVVRYRINAESWSDHAISERFVAVPGEEMIKPVNNIWKAWTFPKDSVLVKTLSLEQIAGDLSSLRPIETQLLHFDGTDWQPYSYRWNAAGTDAALVPLSGAETELQIEDDDAPGGIRRQIWRFAGRAECQRCHNKWSGPPLGFSTAQLHLPENANNQGDSQLDELAKLLLIEKTVPEEHRGTIPSPWDEQQGMEQRARAYLHVNCAHCHRTHAGSAVLSKMVFDLPMDKTDMVNVRPTQGTFGMHSARVITPGDPYRSILWYRMSKLGRGRMPHIGSSEIDLAGRALIHDWLLSLQDQNGEVNEHSRKESELMVRLSARPSGDDATSSQESLLTSTSGALRLLRAIETNRLPDSLASSIVSAASRHQDAQVRDLFERFLSPSERVQRLGTVVDPAVILSLPGDAERGKQLFAMADGMQCRACHRIGTVGREVGPDLVKISGMRTREELLESILQPSRKVDPPFVTYVAETIEGRVLSGLLVEKTAEQIKLKDARGEVVTLRANGIEQLAPQAQSLMPELLFRDMTAQQLSDLLAYLESLRSPGARQSTP